MKQKVCGKKQSWPVLSYSAIIYLEGLGKNKNLVIAGLWAEIWRRDLLTVYRLCNWGSIPSRSKDYSVHCHAQSIPSVICKGVKRPEREADHSHVVPRLPALPWWFFTITVCVMCCRLCVKFRQQCWSWVWCSMWTSRGRSWVTNCAILVTPLTGTCGIGSSSGTAWMGWSMWFRCSSTLRRN